MNLSNLRIGAKLAAVFSIILLLVAGLGAYSVSRMAVINDSTRDIANNWLPSVEALGRIHDAVGLYRQQEMQHVLSLSEAEMRDVDKRLAEARTVLAKEELDYEKLIASSEERAANETFKQALEGYFAVSGRLLALSWKGAVAVDETKALLRGESLQQYLKVGKALAGVTEVNSTGAHHAAQEAESAYRSARAWVVVVLLSVIVAAALLAAWMTRLITRPLAQALAAADRIAQGDLTVELKARGKDEPAQLLAALSNMVGSLRAVVAEVRLNAEGVATASQQIADGNADLSSRTEQQAASLQETASSMEELTSAVQQSAGNAAHGNRLARSASDMAERGGAVVAEVVSTMRQISDGSQRIAEINAVVDGIAFQTNILALNAAVEAARAGEAGRGFAVVAAEVRTLAQRSAQAAREIKQLIDDSTKQVQIGARLADEAGGTMTEVVGSIRRVTDLMGEITAASQEQSTGIEQVNDAVTQMDQVTQQNAALVEESAAAASSLGEQARSLVRTVSVFRVER